MKNKKRMATTLGAVALVATIAIGGTMAYFTDKDQAENVFVMGKVEGELTEPIWDKNNKDGEIEDVMPGDKVVKDPVLTLDEDSEDAYVRFHVTFEGLTAKQISELKFYKGNTEVKLDANGYFYVNTKLTAGDTYQLFDSVRIPTTWGNEMVSKEYKINVTAEMIQADNFTPQRDANRNIIGWGDVDIQQL